MSDSARARARDARQESVLSRLINEGLEESDKRVDPNMPVERWFRSLQFTSSRILKGLRPTQISGPPREYSFSECARMLYTIRMVLPTHPDYQVFIADPLVRTQVNTVIKELFERFKTLKREILEHAPIRDADTILEDEEAWSGLIRDLQLEDEAETVAKEEIHSPSEGSTPEDPSSASSSIYQAPASTTSQTIPGTIPDEPPSPRSYWIDLYPIEDAGHGHGCISEEPPVPLSHWIDLRRIEDYEGLVPEVAPEPKSTFLDLFPLENSSIPEISPSPADFLMELHELHD